MALASHDGTLVVGAKRQRAWLLREALDIAQQAQRQADTVLYSQWPVGSEITWTTNGANRFKGIVIAHGYSDRIKVRRNNTGRERWLHARQVIE